jgi:hypothetical protein
MVVKEVERSKGIFSKSRKVDGDRGYQKNSLAKLS